LHPQLKTEYLKKVNWLPSWIDEVTRLLRDEYDTRYAASAPTSTAPNTPARRLAHGNDSEEDDEKVRLANLVHFGALSLIVIDDMIIEHLRQFIAFPFQTDARRATRLS
jgi:hypothetical protein